jgi:hypothetical protein
MWRRNARTMRGNKKMKIQRLTKKEAYEAEGAEMTTKATCLCGKEVALVHKERIKDLDDRLYNLNANISAMFMTKFQKPTFKHMEEINKELGEIIKEVRNLEEHV